MFPRQSLKRFTLCVKLSDSIFFTDWGYERGIVLIVTIWGSGNKIKIKLDLKMEAGKEGEEEKERNHSTDGETSSLSIYDLRINELNL